jgi:hypothetical protein
MMEQNYTRQYIYKNQPTDVSEIPPGADFICILTDEDDQLVVAETCKSGYLELLEGLCGINETTEQAAQRIMQVLYGDDLDLSSDIPIKIYVNDVDGFVIPFEVDEGHQVVVYERFQYLAQDRSFTSDSPFNYTVELIAGEPEGLVLKRAYLDLDRQLMAIEYPFYTVGEDQMFNQVLSFSEFSAHGEAFILNNSDKDDEFYENPDYLYPAGKDDYLNPVNHYVRSDKVGYVDLEFQPVAPEQISDTKDILAIYFREDDNVLAADRFNNHHWESSEVLDVPLDMHYFVFHAYIRQLHRQMILISLEPTATHYVKIYSPVSDISTESIKLENGQTMQRITTFHVNGNMIAHECNVFNSDETQANQYWLSSPMDDEIIHEGFNPGWRL